MHASACCIILLRCILTYTTAGLLMIREEINGQTFLDLSDTDLKELKLPMGHREVLLSRIDLLKHSA